MRPKTNPTIQSDHARLTKRYTRNKALAEVFRKVTLKLQASAGHLQYREGELMYIPYKLMHRPERDEEAIQKDLRALRQEWQKRSFYLS